MNVSGFPKSRFMQRLMTDEPLVRKVKNAVKATPVIRLVEASLLEGDGAEFTETGNGGPETRQRLREAFRDDVSRLVECAGLSAREFRVDFR